MKTPVEPVHTTLEMQAPPERSLGVARRYAEALAAALIASALSWVLRDQLVGTRILLLWVMSAIVSWRCGFGPVLLASVLAVVFRDVVLLTHPGDAFGAPNVTEGLLAVVYIVVSAFMGRRSDALRRAQTRLSSAADGMLDAMLVYDKSWRLVFYNAAGARIIRSFGLEPRKLRSQVMWDEMPALRGTPFELETKRAREENRAVEYEAKYPEADIWVRVRTVPTADGGVTSFAHDITSKQRAQSERRRTELRYHALVEASTLMVWSTDPTGAVQDMPVWRAITGQTVEQVRGHGWLDAIHPDDHDRTARAWAAAVAGETQHNVEYRLRNADGRYRWYRVRGVPIRHEGRVVEWVGVFDDIHEEHLAEERRLAVENALAVLGVSLDYEWNLAAVTRLLVPTLADYCSVDVVDASGVLRRVSSTHVDPDKELLLRKLWEEYPYGPDDAGAPAVVRSGTTMLSPDIDPELTRGYARSPEHADMLAQLAPRSFLSVPMITRGQTFGALSLVYSDSRRRYTKVEQEAVEQVAARAATAIENARLFAGAQAANRAKSDFLATMSHELRTPLNAIAGYAELIALGVRGPVTEEQLRDLTRIRQNQQHLLEIITDILNFSRVEAGHTRYSITPVPLTDVLERMESMIEPQARARNITYRYEPSIEPLVVLADRDKLDQVLINLLGNAVKFTPPGGRVALSAACLDGRVRIHVTDNGVGIPEEQLASIFEPFVQLEPALTRTSEGTGLGLAIARELTRGMGGELSASSTPGAGSVFSVELPRSMEG